MLLTHPPVRADQCDQMRDGEKIELRNAKITMHNGRMRLAIDRWGLIVEDSNRDVPTDIPSENFSDVKYEERD